MPKKVLAAKMQKLVCAMLHMQRAEVSKVESLLCERVGKAGLPMLCRVHSSASGMVSQPTTKTNMPTHFVAMASLQDPLPSPPCSMATKVLQISSRQGLLVKVPGCVYFTIAELFNPITPMAKNTAEKAMPS